MTQIVNLILSALTVFGQIVIVFLIINLLILRKKKNKFSGLVQKKAILLSFIVAITATLGSLFYSEIAGYEPCKLCWLQRIFMYPQSILLGMALLKKDKKIIDYSLVLSCIGFVIAAYQYLGQIGVVNLSPCSAIGYSVSCSKVFVMTFGFVTIPLMSATAFAMIILLMINKKFQ